jgi:hypothetical protein
VPGAYPLVTADPAFRQTMAKLPQFDGSLRRPCQIAVIQQAIQGAPIAGNLWAVHRDKALALWALEQLKTEDSAFVYSLPSDQHARRLSDTDDFLVSAPTHDDIAQLCEPLPTHWQLWTSKGAVLASASGVPLKASAGRDAVTEVDENNATRDTLASNHQGNRRGHPPHPAHRTANPTTRSLDLHHKPAPYRRTPVFTRNGGMQLASVPAPRRRGPTGSSRRRAMHTGQTITVHRRRPPVPRRYHHARDILHRRITRKPPPPADRATRRGYQYHPAVPQGPPQRRACIRSIQRRSAPYRK